MSNNMNEKSELRALNEEEINAVSGGNGFNSWQSGGVAVMGLGFAGGPVTAGFGLAVGGAMLFVGSFA